MLKVNGLKSHTVVTLRNYRSGVYILNHFNNRQSNFYIHGVHIRAVKISFPVFAVTLYTLTNNCSIYIHSKYRHIDYVNHQSMLK